MSQSKPSSVSRRTVFAGAGALGALGGLAVATKLPGALPEAKPVATTAEAPPSGGYQLSEHVKRYYATARV
jgi:hypothetical protein